LAITGLLLLGAVEVLTATILDKQRLGAIGVDAIFEKLEWVATGLQ
jgi:hypothetical protein